MIAERTRPTFGAYVIAKNAAIARLEAKGLDRDAPEIANIAARRGNGELTNLDAARELDLVAPAVIYGADDQCITCGADFHDPHDPRCKNSDV